MSYSIYKRASHSENKWQELYASDDTQSISFKAIGTYKITKPTIFCLGGNGTIDDKLANGTAKMAENLIGLAGDESVDLISIKYRQEPFMRVGRASFNDVEGRDIAKNIFLPQALDENGNRLSVEQACKNMRLINIFGFCYGNNVKNIITSELNRLLVNKGYTDAECGKILEQVYCVCYAPMKCYSQDTSQNFFIKSFNDLTFGMDYEKEKFGDDTTPVNIGCGVVERKGKTVNLYTEKVSTDDDHILSNLKRNEKWQLDVDEYSFRGDIASICLASALEYGVLNSIENFNSPALVPVDLSVVEEDCQAIINVANQSKQGQEVDAENEQRIQDYVKEHTTVKFKDVLKELNIAERDIISGLAPIGSFINEYKGIVDYSGTTYNKALNTRYHFINHNAKKAVIDKRHIVALEIVTDFGIIFSDGDFTLAESKNKILNSALYHKLFMGRDLTGSIKFEVQIIDGEKCLVLSDNYGSYNDKDYHTASALEKDWKTTYADCDLTITPTPEQEIVIQNLCTNYCINPKNIVNLTSGVTV